MKKVFIAMLVLACQFTAALSQPAKTQILWDNYGVPHIYAKTSAGMYYAFGWAQMHNHADLLLQLYGLARGRGCEYWGDRWLNNDETVHQFDLAGLSEKVYAEQKDEYKAYLDAFVKGINDYAKAHPEAIGADYKQVLPITAQDVLAHCINVLSLNFVAGNNIYSAKQEAKGSNAMAIAASRSASKHAMLLANPHLPWSGFYTFFEAHLNGPGFDAYGATLAGFPILAIAFNHNLGWSHTVNTMDASTRYELKLKDNGYVLDGAVVPFETRTVIIKIKQKDGAIKEEQLICKNTRQGPVIVEKSGKAFALRIAGLDNGAFIEQYHKMCKATNFAEFESAEKMLQMPMFNTIYADKAGNVFYLDGGDIPDKGEGTFAFWHGKVDGTQSKYIWTKTLPYSQLPKVFDPPSGFVQNSNDVPWTCTYPMVLDYKEFPSYIAPGGDWQTGDMREQRGVHMIGDNHAITFDQLVGFKLNTGIEFADRFTDDLLKAAAQYPDSLTTKAAEVLQKWDRRADTSSRGAVLFFQWVNLMRNDPGDPFINDWSWNDPFGTPNGLKDPKRVAANLKRAAQVVSFQYGSLDVPFGLVYRFRGGGLDLPADGAPSYYGSYRAIGYRRDDDKKFEASVGDSYVAVTEFGPKVHAMVCLSYGNASQPGNKHVYDQLKLMSAKKLRPALLDKADVLKNLEEKEDLGY
jgi:acyl-homoserine-lactone acylase